MILQIQKVQVYQTKTPNKTSEILASKILQNTDPKKSVLSHWHCSSVFTAEFKKISHIVLSFSLLTLNM